MCSAVAQLVLLMLSWRVPLFQHISLYCIVDPVLTGTWQINQKLEISHVVVPKWLMRGNISETGPVSSESAREREISVQDVSMYAH